MTNSRTLPPDLLSKWALTTPARRDPSNLIHNHGQQIYVHLPYIYRSGQTLLHFKTPQTDKLIDTALQFYRKQYHQFPIPVSQWNATEVRYTCLFKTALSISVGYK